MTNDYKYYIAIDWGATSGRVMVARVLDGDIRLREVYRFTHSVVQGADGHWYWDFNSLLSETLTGLREAAGLGHKYESVGVDTWGVDVAFYGGNGQLLYAPLAYRDPFTTDAQKQFYEQMSAGELYGKTGIQQMHFNTVFKLYACQRERYLPLLNAEHILFLPDAVSYFLTGQMVCEYSVLSTSAMLNPVTKDFDEDILSLCGLRREQFPDIVYPGQVIGSLKPEIIAQTGLNADCRVVAVAGHDTASAVAAVPRLYNGKRVAYLSSGTWSLMGTVVDSPVITEQSMQLNFTNEGGVNGTTRLLKNITGMWILEQCRKQWSLQGKRYSYPQLIDMAESVCRVPELFNPDEPRFANPEDMLSEVAAGRSLTDAEIVSCIFHSLAQRYGEVFDMLCALVGEAFGALYIIGGGAQNSYLNSLTKQAVGVPVLIGSTEATAIGNIMVQNQNNPSQF